MPHVIRSPFRSLAPPLFVAVLMIAGCARVEGGSSPGFVKADVLYGKIRAGDAPLVVDVRTPEEYAAGHVPGALNIPFDQMRGRATEIASGKKSGVVLYCHSGRRAGIAAKTLEERGFGRVDLLEGNMPGWERDGYPVER